MRPAWIEEAHQLRALRDRIRLAVIKQQEIGYVCEKRIEQELEDQDLLTSNDPDEVHYAAQTDMNQLLFEIRQQIVRSTQNLQSADIDKIPSDIEALIGDSENPVSISIKDTLLNICGEEIIDYFENYSPPVLGELGTEALQHFEAVDVDKLNKSIDEIMANILESRNI